MQLLFVNETPPGSKRISGEAFHVDAAGIRARPEGEVVARHVNDRWLVDGDLFRKIECREGVECRFDNGARPAPQPQGPFDHLAIVDGVLIADQRPLAMLDERRGWNSLAGDETWLGFSLVPAR